MIDRAYAVEDSYREKVEEVLRSSGFEDVARMPRLCLYDYEARKDGRTVYIEVKSRSIGHAPIFTFKESKLRRLRELKEQTGREVYILLIQGADYRLFEIDSTPGDLKPFKLCIASDVKSYRSPVKGELTGGEKKQILVLRRMGLPIREIARRLGRSPLIIRRAIPSEPRRTGGRYRYIRNLTTIAVDRDVAEQLRKLRLNRGEPLGEVVRRLVEEYARRARAREIVGY